MRYSLDSLTAAQLSCGVRVRCPILTLIVLIATAPWQAGLVQAQAPAHEPASNVDEFPKRVKLEGVRGETVRLSGTFTFYLPAGLGRHLPVDAAIARRLSGTPLVTGGDGLRQVSGSFTCAPVAATRREGSAVYKVLGGRVIWAVVLEAELPGYQSLEVEFPEIALAQGIVANGVPDRSDVPRIVADVQLWASRQDKEAADERQRLERLAEAERKAVWRHRAGMAIASLVLVGLLLHRLRHRLWPDVKVFLSPGGHVQKNKAMASRYTDAGVPYGTLVETIWARDFWLRRHPLKVEYLAGVSDAVEDAEDLVARALGADLRGQPGAPKPSLWPAGSAKLDVLVTAGASVRPGSYLAVGRHGSVRVKVT